MHLTIIRVFKNEKIVGRRKSRAINAAAGTVIISLE